MDSWKEIAAFFDKDVRTVRRWEASRRLPVHRVPGGGRSGVFAYVAELKQWLEAEWLKPEAEGLTPELPAESLAGAVELPNSLPNSASASRSTSEGEPRLSFLRRHAVKILLVPALCLVLTAGIALSLQHARKESAASAQTGAAVPSPIPEAQELYLRGQYLMDQRTESSLLQAADLFTQAIVHDPRFAAAYAGLAESYILLRQYGRMLDAEAFPRALAASRQALALAPDSAQALRDHAFLLNYWVWDAETANREFERSLALRPDDAQTHHWYATSLYSQARCAEALREIEKARELQPNAIAILANRGLLLAAIDESDALAYLEELEKVNPTFPTIPTHLAGVYFMREQWRPMLAEYQKAARLRKDDEELALLQRGVEEQEQHGPVAMLRVIADGYAKLVDDGRANAIQPAIFYAKIGDKQRALHYLHVACDRREAGFLGFYKEKVFSPLQQTPEFKDLVAQTTRPLDMNLALRTNLPHPGSR